MSDIGGVSHAPESGSLCVYMLGGFSVKYGDKQLDDEGSRSKKTWMLLEYLIAFRGKEITQEELIDLLWPDGDEVDNPSNTLKTLLYRARGMLEELGFADGKEIITSRRGGYSWNTKLPVWIDVDEFERLYKEGSAGDEDVRLERYQSAIDLYRGDFLPKNALELWVTPINTYYRTLYMKMVGEASRILREHGDYDRLIKVCRSASEIDPCDEEVQYNLIDSLVHTGRRQAALAQYNSVTDMFYNKYGINPSDRLQKLYTDVVKTENATETDMNVIKSSLQEADEQPGAFYCEYEFFRQIYRLEARSAARTGRSVFVCLLTVTDTRSAPLSQRVMNKAMERLHDVIMHSLRRGDVFARYSVSQYLVMLPMVTYESGDMVARRISSAFHTVYPTQQVMLQYRLQPIEPKK